MRAHVLDELRVARLDHVHPLAVARAELHDRPVRRDLNRVPGGSVERPIPQLGDRRRAGHQPAVDEPRADPAPDDVDAARDDAAPAEAGAFDPAGFAFAHSTISLAP